MKHLKSWYVIIFNIYRIYCIDYFYLIIYLCNYLIISNLPYIVIYLLYKIIQFYEVRENKWEEYAHTLVRKNRKKMS